MEQSEKSKLTANGVEYDLSQFKSFGCFLEQDDALFQGSTPRELFTFAATLRTDLSPNLIRKKVDQMISLLGL